MCKETSLSMETTRGVTEEPGTIEQERKKSNKTGQAGRKKKGIIKQHRPSSN